MQWQIGQVTITSVVEQDLTDLNEIVWGAKFRNIFNPPDAQGRLSIDIHRIDQSDPVSLPA